MILKTLISLSLITTVALQADSSHSKQEKHMEKIEKKHMEKMHKRFKKGFEKKKEEIKEYSKMFKELKKESIKSHNNYDKNENGVITAKTLTKWIDNWQKNKPKNIEGNLIILQGDPSQYADSGKPYLTPNEEEGVYVYDIGPGGACDASYKRFDGVSDEQAAIINVDTMNMLLNQLHIDPSKDMVVIMNAGSDNASMKGLTRVWMTFKYFGTDLKHLAFLNGSLSYEFAPGTKYNKYLGARPSGYPQMGNFDVRTLGTHGIKTLETTEDMMKAASEKLNLNFIADARETEEYDGSVGIKSSGTNCGINHDEQCYTAYRGHVKTAASMPYTSFYDTTPRKDINGDGILDSKDASYEFKSIKELKKLYRKAGYKKHQIINAYCRTGRKANLVLFTASSVLGYPVRMYDGSWIQWGSLANAKDTNGVTILGEKNKWRTDVPKYSTVIKYEDPINVQPFTHVSYNEENTDNRTNEVRIDENGTTTSLQIEEDLASYSE